MQRRECASTQPAEVSDSLLVRQVLAGDKQAFEILMHRYHALVSHCISCYLRDYDQTCDMLQRVWLQLYISLPTLRTGRPLGPWLLRVAQNCCLDELRKRRRWCVVSFSELGWKADEEEPMPLAMIPDPHPLPEEIAEYHDLQDALKRAMQALPPRTRAIVLLRYVGQLSFAEIGQALQMPTTTVKTSFYRARPRLAATLLAEWQTTPVDRVWIRVDPSTSYADCDEGS